VLGEKVDEEDECIRGWSTAPGERPVSDCWRMAWRRRRRFTLNTTGWRVGDSLDAFCCTCAEHVQDLNTVFSHFLGYSVSLEIWDTLSYSDISLLYVPVDFSF
jgi:hypothetical protein